MIEPIVESFQEPDMTEPAFEMTAMTTNIDSAQDAKTTEQRSAQVSIDPEGRIVDADATVATMLGYAPAELVGRRRLAALFPGQVVLANLPSWLAQASTKGTHTVQAPLRRQDGLLVAAAVKLQRQGDAGIPSGFLIRLSALKGVDPASLLPRLTPGLRLRTWLHITRAPFLTATLVPMVLAAAWVWARGLAAPFPWLGFGLTLLGALALHVAANTFNDFFDWASGTDQLNNDQFAPLSGGSRSVELGLISQRGMFSVALGATAIAAVVGLLLVWLAGPVVLGFGLAGLLLGYFYTAPPLRLVARNGLGELAIVLSFGPLMTAGAVYAMTGAVALPDFLLGLPPGLLTTAILWINQFPDAAADAAGGKRHLVVTLGPSRARWGYVALVSLAFATVLAAVLADLVGPWVLLSLLAAPLAVHACVVLVKHWQDRSLVRANAATIQLHLVSGLTLTAGLVIGRLLGG